ncbi:hypothetical protein DFJ58DRAFT_668186, partial [Suillus subalutaceus]|uniref:uncharacterized protein n=1 Tax=Suillus subalutaceus TaxID=48586 RepID=UPI001B85BF70
PDLPFRLLKAIALERGDQATWYMPGNLTPAGYSDWPFAPENGQEQISKFWHGSVRNPLACGRRSRVNPAGYGETIIRSRISEVLMLVAPAAAA